MPIRRKGRRNGNNAADATVDAIHVQSYQQHDADVSDVNIQLSQHETTLRGNTYQTTPGFQNVQRSNNVPSSAGGNPGSTVADEMPRPLSSVGSGRDIVSDKLLQVSSERRLKQLEPPVMYSALPVSRPLTLCFDITGTGTTHKQVYRSVMETIEHIPDARICRVQFGARNVMLGTMWVDNRWVIDVSTRQCVNVLIGRGIQLNNDTIKLRRYDDVIREEYDKFQQYMATRKPSKKSKSNATQALPPSPNAMDLLKNSEQAKTTVDDVTSQMQAIHA